MQDSLPRKLTAILYADVSGYSRKVDDDLLHTTLRNYLGIFADTTAANRGRVVHYAGDAVLAEFGSVADALTTAAEVQTDIQKQNVELPVSQQLWFRVGVNLGDVVVDGVEIYGNGVNVAARLESLAEPGGVCVSDAARAAAGTYLPFAFEFMGEIRVKNIEDPVRPYRLLFGKDAKEGGDATQAAAEPELESAGPEQGAIRPSVLILPFKNLSGDPDQEYLAEGFTEDVITELTRFHSLSVVARTSAFAFRDQSINLQTIAEQLGKVDFALEGSIRRLAERLRVTVRLVECGGGTQVWTQRYDADIDDIFQTQDRLISDIVSHLEGRVTEERLRVTGQTPTQTLKAYDLWLRGHQLMREWKPDSDHQSVTMFERCIRLAPDFARPYASLAGIYSSRTLLLPGNPDSAKDLERAKEYATKGVRLDPLDGKVHLYLGWAYMLERQFVAARKAFEQAGELNPNDADITISRALALAHLGEPERAFGLAAKAAERNPLHPDYYLEYTAMIRFLAERYEETAAMLAPFADQALPDIWAWYAAACSHLGRNEEAHRGLNRFIESMQRQWVGPDSAGPLDYAMWFIQITPLARSEDIERLASGLRNAGFTMPEGLDHWGHTSS